MLAGILSSKRTSLVGIGAVIVTVLTTFGPMLGISADAVAALEKIVLLIAGGGFLVAKDG
ncbi:hypothetical protein [uncultured Mediterranean phage uvDeep-CGR2-AD3-C191]|nr:hypothetical protein [uncultured Mediterranean phage uvDeep-CGR2-AD3-C191]